jgi:hypothetical protein
MKKVSIFLTFFVIIFTVNGALSAFVNDQSFFYFTPTKLFIRVFIAWMLTVLYGDKILSFYEKRKNS